MSPTLLTIFGFTLPVSLILPVVPTLGTNEFEFRMGFGISHRVPDAESAFVLKAEGQYQRVLIEDENANEFSFIIGFGTRFGNDKASTFEVPITR